MQGSGSSKLSIRCICGDYAAVIRSVSVAEPKRGRRAAVDAQSAAMTGTMMSAAQREQVLPRVTAAFFTRLNVVHIDEGRMPAAWHLAAVLVPLQHRTPHRRRNGLSRFGNVLGLTHVGTVGLTHAGNRKDLRIAARHRRHIY